MKKNTEQPKKKRGRKPKVQVRDPKLDVLEWLRLSRRDAYQALKFMIEVDTDYDERSKLLETIINLDELVEVTRHHAFCE